MAENPMNLFVPSGVCIYESRSRLSVGIRQASCEKDNDFV
jgi:hypothetical protein